MILWHYRNPEFNHLKVGMRVQITEGQYEGQFGTLIDERNKNILLDDGNKWYGNVPRKDGRNGEFKVIDKQPEVSKVPDKKDTGTGWGFEDV